MNKPTNLNGWQNIGQLYQLSTLISVPDKLLSTYLIIGKFSLGYCRADTNVPADQGTNRNASYWAKQLGKGKSTFLRNIAELEAAGFITVHSGSNYRLDGGSYPNWYSIKYFPSIQTKHGIYFTTNSSPVTITKPIHEPEPVELPNPEHYTWLHNIVRPLFDENGEPNTTHDFLINHSTLSINHPTQDELNKHKGLTYANN